MQNKHEQKRHAITPTIKRSKKSETKQKREDIESKSNGMTL